MKRLLELLGVMLGVGTLLGVAVYLDWLEFEEASFLLAAAVFKLGMKHGKSRSD